MIGKILAVASTLLVLVADSGNKQWLFLIFFLLFLGFDHAAADGGKGDGRTNDRKGAARSRYSSVSESVRYLAFLVFILAGMVQSLGWI